MSVEPFFAPFPSRCWVGTYTHSDGKVSKQKSVRGPDEGCLPVLAAKLVFIGARWGALAAPMCR